jgi:endoglucanase
MSAFSSILRRSPRRVRRAAALLAGMLGVLLAVLIAGHATVQASTPLAVYVNGNHFVNGDGNIVRLTGTGADSTEYACADQYAYSSYDVATAEPGDPVGAGQAFQSMASWGANVTRIPLNQDCWLGINGLPNFGTAIGYRSYIEQAVAEANAAGLYVIIDLHWTGPTVSDGQRQMPDQDSIAFWDSVAAEFKDNHAVIFDAFNEPVGSEAGDPNLTPLSWSCWENGGCPVADYNEASGSSEGPNYTAVGMQAMVDAIRSTGATQPIILGGLDYSGDLSQWLTYQPHDQVSPPQLAASFHDYDDSDPSCSGATACLGGSLENTLTSVAAQVPLVTGEFGYFDGDSVICSDHSATDFANTYMNWADQNGISYVAFAWLDPALNNSTASSIDGSCTNFASRANTPQCTMAPADDPCAFSAHLIDAQGNPAAPLGTEVHDHLATVNDITSPGPGVPTITPIGSMSTGTSTGTPTSTGTSTPPATMSTATTSTGSTTPTGTTTSVPPRRGPVKLSARAKALAKCTRIHNRHRRAACVRAVNRRFPVRHTRTSKPVSHPHV